MERHHGEATSESIYAKLRNPQLWRPAVADKLEDLSYVGYFDADEPFKGAPIPEWCYRVFETPNGFHVISCGRLTAPNKKHWHDLWKSMYPASDYQLSNLNWLSPHSMEEADFITRVARGVPLMCVFYRDKAVFETWASR